MSKSLKQITWGILPLFCWHQLVWAAPDIGRNDQLSPRMVLSSSSSQPKSAVSSSAVDTSGVTHTPQLLSNGSDLTQLSFLEKFSLVLSIVVFQMNHQTQSLLARVPPGFR